MKINAADEFASMFGVASESDVRASLIAAQQQCDEKYQFYDKAMKHIKANLVFVLIIKIETSFFGIFKLGTENRALFLVIMVCICCNQCNIESASHWFYVVLLLKLISVFMVLRCLLANALLTSSVINNINRS